MEFVSDARTGYGLTAIVRCASKRSSPRPGSRQLLKLPSNQLRRGAVPPTQLPVQMAQIHIPTEQGRAVLTTVRCVVKGLGLSPSPTPTLCVMRSSRAAIIRHLNRKAADSAASL